MVLRRGQRYADHHRNGRYVRLYHQRRHGRSLDRVAREHYRRLSARGHELRGRFRVLSMHESDPDRAARLPAEDRQLRIPGKRSDERSDPCQRQRDRQEPLHRASGNDGIQSGPGQRRPADNGRHAAQRRRQNPVLRRPVQKRQAERSRRSGHHLRLRHVQVFAADFRRSPHQSPVPERQCHLYVRSSD